MRMPTPSPCEHCGKKSSFNRMARMRCFPRTPFLLVSSCFWFPFFGLGSLRHRVVGGSHDETGRGKDQPLPAVLIS